jgi:hypothetical protein
MQEARDLPLQLGLSTLQSRLVQRRAWLAGRRV